MSTIRRTRIRYLREQKSLSQSELARMIDSTQQTVSTIEKGKITRPHPKTLRKLAEALQVSVNDLFTTDSEQADSAEEHIVDVAVPAA